MRKMKDSGAAWIGMIPSHWGILENKFYCEHIYSGGTPDSNNPGYWDGDIPWIPSGSCQDCVITSAPKSITQDGLSNSSTRYIPAGTTVMAMTGATCSKVGYVTFDTCMNQSVIAFVENKKICSSKYLFYLYQAAREYILTFQTGGAQSGINGQDCRNLVMPYLPILEQQRIAGFLDRKCADIDNVLKTTKASIEDYKKLKQSVITKAITKGIRGERPMKDSGIEWIGNIPEDWSKYRKLSSICSKGISYGIVKLFEPDENGVKVLRCSDVQPGFILTNNIRTVTKELSNEYKRTILNGGEIVINVRGTLGGCAIVPDSMRGYNIAREVALVDTFGINKKYLMYFFLSDLFKLYQQMNLAGSVYVGLNIELLSSCPILKPSLEEQEEIGEYLDQKCSEIDSLIASKEKFIAELESYKKSLIYEYVTGKKEVPEI